MKKTVCIALLLTMLIMTACTASKPTETDTSKLPDETTVAETSYFDVLPKKNFDGYEFNMISSYLFSESDNFPGDNSNGEIINDTMYDRNRTVEDMYNITIVCRVMGGSESDGVSQINSKVKESVMSGDGVYDTVIMPMMGSIASLMTNSCLYDLKQIPYLTLDSELWCKTIYENMQLDGKLMFTTGGIASNMYFAPYVIAFNINAAENLGYNDIYDVALDGAWTFDKLTEYMKGVSHDLNGDGEMGKDDYYAMTIEDVAGYGYYVSAGNKFTETTSDKPDTSCIISDRSISFIEKAGPILGDTDNVLRAEKFPKVHPTVKYNMTLFTEGRSLFISTSMDALIIAGRDMDNDYGIIPCPKYDENQSEYYAFANPWVNSAIGVPYDCKDAERTGLILETLAYISYEELRPAEYGVILKEKIARDDKSQQMLDVIYGNIYYDLDSAFNFGGSFSLVRQYVLGESGGNIASAYEKISQKATAEIESLMNTVSEMN